ncbi:hypothetical protein QBC41DRAFT_316489 [Cercophora samala]|uniref:Heterokaryon incompatibility domain-containing protein n=1 Tax=Cercophora samala TaxID=330535 RepID=A0AA39ZHZ8_9PEZI|nr:hypothetical protein QBC41DRAFT_316489 [Cercophora samala]
MDSSNLIQLHKCGAYPIIEGTGCHQMFFPVELLETALQNGESTAWMCDTPVLSGSGDPYIAITHVWSDGTGMGADNTHTVNACLFQYFAKLGNRLNCNALWWDAISVPKEPKARRLALNNMHENYANAEYTIIHDTYLVNFPWSDDGSPCIAMILSTWFTRGWTALELFMSKKVLVLFKDPAGGCEPLMKDLDDEILAQSPATSSPAHWLATTLIRRLRRPIDNVGDLLAALSTRSTSWVRDRTIISALLAQVPDCDLAAGESIIATQVLGHLGQIPHNCLFHGKPTMRDSGPWSWCPATLHDMPVDTAPDLGDSGDDSLKIKGDGSVEGKWRCRKLDADDVANMKPYGDNLAAAMKIESALGRWEGCLLLRHPRDGQGNLALLVWLTSINLEAGMLECRYIGTVVVASSSTALREGMVHGFSNPMWSVRIGGKVYN